MFKTIPEFSVDGHRLAEILRQTPVDGLVSYADLSTSIKRNVQKEGRSALSSARRQMQREAAMVFEPVRNVGMKRLNDCDIVRTSQSSIKHINRTARRGVTRLACVSNYAGLSREEMIRHNTAMSLLGMFHEITKVKNVKQIEAVVAVAQRTLPLAQTLEAFRF